MKDDNQFVDLVPILWSWRKALIMGFLCTLVVSVIITLLLPNYYRSRTIFYPVNASLTKPIVDANDRSLTYYGDDNDTDRLLSIGHSVDLVYHLAREFNLADHYEIDTSKVKAQDQIFKKFNKLYSIHKTPQDAIELTIEDVDPEIAKQLTIGARTFIENKARSIAKTSQMEIISSTERNVNQQLKKLDGITSEISRYRKEFGIYDTQFQAEAFATLEIKSGQNSGVQKRIVKYNEGIAELKKLEIEQEELSKVLVYDSDLLDKLKQNHDSHTTMLHVIDEARVALDKSRPRRSLLVLGVSVVSLLFGMMLVVFIEKRA